MDYEAGTRTRNPVYGQLIARNGGLRDRATISDFRPFRSDIRRRDLMDEVVVENARVSFFDL